MAKEEIKDTENKEAEATKEQIEHWKSAKGEEE